LSYIGEVISSEQLRDDLLQRRIQRGFDRLGGWSSSSVDPADPDAGHLVGYLSQWVDIGYGDVSLVGPYHPSTFAFGGFVKGIKPADMAGWTTPIPAAAK